MNARAPVDGGRLPEKGLGLALEILEQVARGHQRSSAADIARAVGAPRATVYRVVNALVRDEYLVRRPDFSGFLLGARVLELAAVVDAHRAPPSSGIVERVRVDTGEAVHLFGFHDAGVTIVEEDARYPLSDRATLLNDPTRSAVGHLWLAERPRRNESGAHRWRVAVAAADIEAITDAYVMRGYTEQVASLAPDRGCLAVPIRDSRDEPVGAICLATPLTRFSLAARHLSALRDAATALGGQMSLQR
ncbi:helix-turn-helix domain-containing protein [Microbacterium lacus]|uniref:IclR family transcriptional regulator n=1 Tax=Microbacterium lacus TaxID=415217 RepID=UPI003850873B